MGCWAQVGRKSESHGVFVLVRGLVRMGWLIGRVVCRRWVLLVVWV